MDARTRAVSAAESTLSNVEAVADAAEDMSDTVRNLVTNMNGAKRAVTEINSQATTIDHSTNKMRDAAKSMDSVVQLIAQVAKETNMLALNATIEAARAGESGRGFAVVAQEVKSLAAQTANATTRISSEIAAMQTIADEVVTTLASVTGAIQQAHGLVETATSEIEAQSSVTVEISDNMRTTADDVASIARTLDDWIIGMEERCFDERRRVNTPVKLLLSNGASIAGSLRNLSRGGGKLLVADPQSVPDFFQLQIDGESDMRNCQVIRRGSNEVGVRFRSAMRA
jgi:methyl-accepting chemotaxis protein